MIRFLKINLLGLYALAVLSLAFPMPWDSNSLLQRLSAVLLVLHVAEMLVAFKHLRAYPGPLWKSIALCVLFGALHWLPLAKKTPARP